MPNCKRYDSVCLDKKVNGIRVYTWFNGQRCSVSKRRPSDKVITATELGLMRERVNKLGSESKTASTTYVNVVRCLPSGQRYDSVCQDEKMNCHRVYTWFNG